MGDLIPFSIFVMLFLCLHCYKQHLISGFLVKKGRMVAVCVVCPPWRNVYEIVGWELFITQPNLESLFHSETIGLV